MTEQRAIETEPGLVFDVLVDGAPDAPLELLLHGFAESFHMWREQLPALAAAGYRAVAPSQRGYSTGARPRASDLANYHFDKLVADALAVADAFGPGSGRFHLVGHDWGVRRSAPSPYRCSIFGARPTTRSGALRPKTRATSCQVPIALKRCRASGISPSIRPAGALRNFCSRISPAIRLEPPSRAASPSNA